MNIVKNNNIVKNAHHNALKLKVMTSVISNQHIILLYELYNKGQK